MADVKVKLVTDKIHTEEGGVECFYGLDFVHTVDGKVHSLVATAEAKVVKSLLDAKIVVKA